MLLSKRVRLMTAAALTLIASVAAYAEKKPAFDAIYVFGDSYCDVGNLFAASGGTVPGAPYYHGRFSNGPLWVEHLAGTYGVPMQPSLLGGTDFAFGGAEVLAPVPEGSAAIPSVAQQVGLYLSLAKFKADPKALYIVEGGGNDILNATGGSPQVLGGEIAFGLLTSVRALQRAGARTILVPRLFDVGLTPAAKARGISSFASTATAALNEGLDAGLALESYSEDTHIVRIDTLSLQHALITDPTHYGFADVVTPCLNQAAAPPTLCSDPAAHYYWDSVHPTVFGHSFFAVLAEQALQHEHHE